MSKFDGFKYGYYITGQDIVEAVSNTRESSMGTEVKRRILLGTFITMEEFRDRWYTKALKARSAIKEDFERIFKTHDLLLSNYAMLPPKTGERITDPLQCILSDILTASANLAGICAQVSLLVKLKDYLLDYNFMQTACVNLSY